MISVCIATYNGEEFIKEQIESILCQISDNDEVIISDDNSTDSTIEIINGFKDNRIKVIINERGNRGVIGNFENAIVHSQNAIVFLSDQDDIWLPNKVDRMLSEFEKGASLVLSNCQIIDREKKVIVDSFYEFRRSKKGFFCNLYRNSFIGCCMAFKKDLKNFILPFPKKIPMHDSWIGLSAFLVGKVSFIDDKLVYYRMHENYSDTASGVSRYGFIYKMKFRLQLLVNLLLRKMSIK